MITREGYEAEFSSPFLRHISLNTALSKLRHLHSRPIIQALPSLVLEPEKEEASSTCVPARYSILEIENNSRQQQTENEKFGRAWTLGKEGLKLMYARMLQWKVN
jgi:hypothetical protein